MRLDVQLHDAPVQAGHVFGYVNFRIGGGKAGAAGFSDPAVSILIQTKFQPQVRAAPLPVAKEGLSGANSEYYAHLESRWRHSRRRTYKENSYHKTAVDIVREPKAAEKTHPSPHSFIGGTS